MHVFLFILMIILGTPFFASSIKDQYVTIQADTLELQGKQNLFSALGNVRVQFKGARITGQKGFYYKRDNRVEVQGNVVIKYDGVVVKTNQLVGYGKKDLLVIKGGVNVSYLMIKGTCQEAEYDIQNNRIVLFGNPLVTQEDNRIMGKKMEINFKSGKIRTIGQANVLFEAEEK